MATRANGLHAAVSLFTIVPVPAVEIDRATAARAMRAFPWVGLLLGSAAAMPSGLALYLGAGTVLAAVLALASLALLTGGLHLDGLADTADGLGSRRPAADALAIMKRSDVGPMGVVSLVLVLGVDAAALASPRVGVLLPLVVAAAALVARVPALIGTVAGSPAARAGGFGALFVGVTSRATVVASACAALVVMALGGFCVRGAWGTAVLAAAAVVAWLVAALWQRHLIRRLGGITGDTLGSVIEVAQLTFLVTVAVAF